MKPTGVSSDEFHTKKISKVKRRPAQSQHLADRETARQALIAAIDKSRSSQLRVSLSEWRGNRRAEIREATATIPASISTRAQASRST